MASSARIGGRSNNPTTETAAILADTRELEPEWRDRFNRNVNEDAARLAESAQALVTYLDRAGEGDGGEAAAPQEELDACTSAGGELIQREDDNEQTIRSRLDVYREQTAYIMTDIMSEVNEGHNEFMHGGTAQQISIGDDPVILRLRGFVIVIRILE